MAISFVNSSNGNAGAGVALTISAPASIAQNDVLYAYIIRGAAGTQGITSSGWTRLVDLDGPGSYNFAVLRKVMGASPDSQLEMSDTGAAKAGAIIALRGVDTGTPEDATTTTSSNAGSTNPDCPSITTVTNNAWVLALAGGAANDASVTNPTGYSNQSGVARAFASTWGSTKSVSPAGAENPASYTNWSTGEWIAASVAVRPATATARSLGYIFG